MIWQNILVLKAAFLIGLAYGMYNSNLAEDIADYPYQAQVLESNFSICSAIIVSERHVLTAAHCIFENMTGPYYENVRIITGTLARYPDPWYLAKGSVHEVVNITVHPNMSKPNDDSPVRNDIAVVTLKDKIILDKSQQIIKLPEHEVESGLEGTITGWGTVRKTPSFAFSLPLQTLKTKVMSMEEFRRKVPMPDIMKLDDKLHICGLSSSSYSDTAGPCEGDSGGPFVINGELVGIISWRSGDECGDGYPDAYTNVYTYKNFIKTVMNETMKRYEVL